MANVEAPWAVSSHWTDMESAVRAYVESAKSVAADGLTWAEFGQLLMSLLRLCVRLADALPVAGAEKKALVLAAASTLFDAVAGSCVPLMAWPFWAVIRAPVKALVLAIASGAVESILDLVRTR